MDAAWVNHFAGVDHRPFQPAKRVCCESKRFEIIFIDWHAETVILHKFSPESD